MSVTVSAYQDPYVKENAVDNDLATRWEADGESQWITFDLGSEKPVAALDISFYRGAERENYLEIQVSSDNINWSHSLFNGSSTQTALPFQRFSLNNTLARYIKIIGHGNSDEDNNQISLNEVRICVADQLRYFHSDHLGSATRMTDENGKVVYSIAYDPWGRTVYESDGERVLYKYTDQELDQETGLYNYKARLYDPLLGRFIQPDTILDGLNPYTYCGNNPLLYTDPTGHSYIAVGIILGAIIGTYIGGAIANQSLNMNEWDWSNPCTYLGMGIGAVGGAIIGGVSFGLAAGEISVAVSAGMNGLGVEITLAIGAPSLGTSVAGGGMGSALMSLELLAMSNMGVGGIGGTAYDEARSIETYEDMLAKEGSPFGYADYIAMKQLKGCYDYPVGAGDISTGGDFGIWRFLFGKKNYHTGIDFSRVAGTPVYAPRDGKVSQYYFNVFNGNTLVIDHAEFIVPRGVAFLTDANKPLIAPVSVDLTMQTRYLYLQSAYVKPGDIVRQGQQIAIVGNTGDYTTGAHLHFDIKCRGWWINPHLLFR